LEEFTTRLIPAPALALAALLLLMAAGTSLGASEDSRETVQADEILGAILAAHEIEDVTVLEMEVPCCSNLEAFVRLALKIGGKGGAS